MATPKPKPNLGTNPKPKTTTFPPPKVAPKAKEKTIEQLKSALIPGGPNGYKIAVIKYVNAEANSLGLKPKDKAALIKKIQPQVEKQILAERKRAYEKALRMRNQ
jgi:hypothetical protein